MSSPSRRRRRRGARAPFTEPAGPDEIPRAVARPPPRARAAAPGRRHRASLLDAVRAARRDDPLGSDDGRRGERRDAGAVCALSGRARDGRGRRRRTRAAHPRDRLLPAEGARADGHGAGPRRAPRRRGAGVDGGARRPARRGPQDRERRPRSCARRAGTARRPARAPRREPHRPGSLGRPGGRRTAAGRGAAPPAVDASRPTR